MYDCIVLAGGYGKRLRPITEEIPKPLVTVGNTPAISGILRSLSECGTKHCAITLMYKGEMIKSTCQSGTYGIKLDWFTETEPLGTAGGAVRVAKSLDLSDSVIVISGDAFFDFDLTDLEIFHEKSGADVTVATYFAKDPTEYGTVICDKDGKITEIMEKAPWSRTVTGRINTGIYIIRTEILKSIDSKSCDFVTDVFARLMSEGKRLYCHDMRGYWNDIGSHEALLSANIDYARKNTALPVSSYAYSGDGFATEDSIFGANCTLSQNSFSDTGIFGTSCNIGSDTLIRESVLFSNVTVGDNVKLSGCIVCEGADIKSGSNYTDKVIAADGRMFSVSADKNGNVKFCDDGILLCKCDYETEQKLGYAIAKSVGNGKIGICHDGSDKAARAARHIASGAASDGARVYDFGKSWKAQTAFAAYAYALAVSVYVYIRDQTLYLSVFDSSTLPVGRDFERAVIKAMADDRTVYERGTVTKSAGLSPSYTDALIKSIYSSGFSLYGLSGASVVINKCPAYTSLFAALTLADCKVRNTEHALSLNNDDILFAEISDDGLDLSVTYKGAKYAKERICSMLCADAALRGEYEIPSSYERLPEVAWADDRLCPQCYSVSPKNGRESLAKFGARRSLWLIDGAFMLTRLIAVLQSRDITVTELAKNTKTVCRYETDVECPDKAKVMDILVRDGATVGDEGVIIRSGGTQATVRCGRDKMLHIIGYSASTEAASDMCAKIKQKISEIKK